MTNPFQLYTPALLEALLNAGHTCFVRQSYQRGMDHFDNTIRHAFLISHYNDPAKARMHYEALPNDGNRFLYESNNAEHLEKLKKAAKNPLGYKIYTPMLSKPWAPPEIMKTKVRKYIDRKLRWQVGAGHTVRTNLFTQFGELFLTLKMGIHDIKIPLSDIECL